MACTVKTIVPLHFSIPFMTVYWETFFWAIEHGLYRQHYCTLVFSIPFTTGYWQKAVSSVSVQDCYCCYAGAWAFNCLEAGNCSIFWQCTEHILTMHRTTKPKPCEVSKLNHSFNHCVPNQSLTTLCLLVSIKKGELPLSHFATPQLLSPRVEWRVGSRLAGRRWTLSLVACRWCTLFLHNPPIFSITPPPLPSPPLLQTPLLSGAALQLRVSAWGLRGGCVGAALRLRGRGVR